MSLADHVAALHRQPIRLVAAVTGGGVGLPQALLTVPGGSRTVLDVQVPYGTAALRRWLKSTPDQYCSAATARAMAAAAWRRAMELRAEPGDAGDAGDAGDDAMAVGLGVTAALASDRPKKGPHRAFLAVQSLGGTSLLHIELDKGRRSRAEEDAVVTAAAVEVLANFLSADPTARPSGLNEADLVTGEAAAFPLAVVGLLDGELDSVVWTPELTDDPATWQTADDIRPGPDAQRWGGLLSGSFNPVHDGHRRLRQAAATHLGQPVGWELPVANADKPPLDALSLRDRLAGLGEPVLLTRAATFSEKARLLPGCVFVVGFDTAVRVLDPRFYGSVAGRDAALEDLKSRGCRFLVAARAIDGTLLDAGALEAGRWGGLLEPLPDFREDISSTVIRARRPS